MRRGRDEITVTAKAAPAGAAARRAGGGFTIVEIMIVVAIIGILAVAFGAQLKGFRGKYQVEQDIKLLFSDMVKYRAKAMEEQRSYFIAFNAVSGNYRYYTVFQDFTNIANDTNADGDQVLDTGADAQITNTRSKMTYYNFSPSIAANPYIGFDRRGIFMAPAVSGTAPSLTVYISNTATYTDLGADYDCMVAQYARINLGRWNNTTSECEEK